MELQRQEKSYWCGNACYAMITGVSQKEARKECQTRYTGTSSYSVKKALENRGYQVISINIDNDYRCLKTHLKLLSKEYYIYCSNIFISNSGKGRNSKRRHATVIWREKFYDPSEDFVCDLDCLEHLYNKQFVIRQVLLIKKP